MLRSSREEVKKIKKKAGVRILPRVLKDGWKEKYFFKKWFI